MSIYAATAAVATVGAIAGLYVAPYVTKWQQRRELRALCERQRCLVLTYDDGPSADITPSLLDLLSTQRAQATFFLRGDHAVANPGVADRIVSEGHEVGCHSARHYHAWTTLPWKLTRDMVEGYRLLSPWMRSDGLYRPPFGKPYLPVVLRLAARRARMAWWTIDSGDTFAVRPSIEKTLQAVKAARGGVIVMHDCKKNSPSHRAYVLELTARLLSLARSEGLALKRFGEVFGAMRWQHQ
jgi:peptidoglycan/xylan/chitin deacetylase (PgdA/CDA1 family)